MSTKPSTTITPPKQPSPRSSSGRSDGPSCDAASSKLDSADFSFLPASTLVSAVNEPPGTPSTWAAYAETGSSCCQPAAWPVSVIVQPSPAVEAEWRPSRRSA